MLRNTGSHHIIGGSSGKKPFSGQKVVLPSPGTSPRLKKRENVPSGNSHLKRKQPACPSSSLSSTRRKKQRRVANEKKKGLTEKKLKELLQITPRMQYARYLGNIPQLRQFLIKEGYHRKKNVFSATKRWLDKKGQQYLSKTLRKGGKESDWTVDHIVPTQRGGIDWPHNYFLMPKSLNSHFGKYNSARKEKYIGKNANNNAEELAKWGSKTLGSSKNDLSKFDPIGL